MSSRRGSHTAKSCLVIVFGFLFSRVPRSYPHELLVRHNHILCSLNVVEHIDGCHESSDANAIILGIANFLSLVVNGIELADFVGVTDCLEQGPNRFTVARHLEV